MAQEMLVKAMEVDLQELPKRYGAEYKPVVAAADPAYKEEVESESWPAKPRHLRFAWDFPRSRDSYRSPFKRSWRPGSRAYSSTTLPPTGRTVASLWRARPLVVRAGSDSALVPTAPRRKAVRL
jgi:hypothetical protein